MRETGTRSAVTVSGRRSAELEDAVEEHAQTRANMHTNRRRREPAVGSGNRERGGRAARSGDAPERRACTTVVPGRCDDEHVERRGTRHRPRQGAVDEGGVRLGQPDERDPCGVMRISVVVGVDRCLEACEQLIGSGVHGVATLRIGLPAGHPNREDGGSRSDSVQSSRAVRADDDPRELGAMTLRSTRRSSGWGWAILRFRAR